MATKKKFLKIYRITFNWSFERYDHYEVGKGYPAGDKGNIVTKIIEDPKHRFCTVKFKDGSEIDVHNIDRVYRK